MSGRFSKPRRVSIFRTIAGCSFPSRAKWCCSNSTSWTLFAKDNSITSACSATKERSSKSLAVRAEPQIALGEIDAFVGPQFFAPQVRLGDPDKQLAILNLFHDATDLAVVEPDGLARPDVIEHFGNGAANHGRRQDLAGTVASCGASELEVSPQNQHVPLFQQNRLFSRRQVADDGLAVLVLPMSPMQHDAGDHIGCLGRFRPDSAIANVNNR